MIRKIIFTLFLICLPALTLAQNDASSDQVLMYEKGIVIPTYRVGEPEVNPYFYLPYRYQNAQRHIYPYPQIDKLTDEKINKKYKRLFLENKYIKICVLPEIGGRLYIALDKTNGYNFFYHNRVIITWAIFTMIINRKRLLRNGRKQ